MLKETVGEDNLQYAALRYQIGSVSALIGDQ